MIHYIQGDQEELWVKMSQKVKWKWFDLYIETFSVADYSLNSEDIFKMAFKRKNLQNRPKDSCVHKISGLSFNHGESKPCVDECNICTCTDGKISQTNNTCPRGYDTDHTIAGGVAKHESKLFKEISKSK